MFAIFIVVLWLSKMVCILLVYRVNSDGLSPLDVAVLSNNKSLIKMLISFGAQEGNECKYYIL